METLFARKGGHRVVARIVFGFYDRVLVSPRLGPFFEGVDMRRLVDHQAKFVASVMGGPGAHTDAELASVHGHLSISDADFDAMLEAMEATLAAEGFSAGEAAEILAALEGRRDVIVRKRPPRPGAAG